MTFTYDITTTIGQLRLRIGNTVETAGSRPNGLGYSDEELQYFLDSAGGSIGISMANVFETLAAEWSSLADLTLGPRREAFSQVAEAFRKRAAEAHVQYGGGGSSFSVGWDRQDGYSALYPTGHSESGREAI
jgi:hypothetical protein